SRICTAEAEPTVFQSCRTQTTFLSGVTSISWGPLPLLPREQKIVLPLARRVQLCGADVNRKASGSSLVLNSQTVSPLGLTSRVRLSCSSVISVLPFLSRRAAHGDRMG